MACTDQRQFRSPPLGGAAVNHALSDHFQSVARGHFTVRRLERKYGKDIVFAAYEQVRQDFESSK
jgi:hypothetical protein